MHETPIADPLAGTAHGLPDSGSVEEIAGVAGEDDPMTLCACGCEQPVRPNAPGQLRPFKYATPNCRKASAEKRRAYFAERYRQARVHLDDGVGLLIQELRAEDA